MPSFKLLLPFLVAPLLFSCSSKKEFHEDNGNYVDLMAEKASRMLDSGQFGRALVFFDSSFHTLKNPGVKDKIQKYSFLGKNYYNKKQEYDTALVMLDSILYELSNDDLKTLYTVDYADVYFFKGDILFKQKKFNEAYHNYYQGKLIAETILDRCAISAYSYRLAMIDYQQGKYVKAASNFKQCLEDGSFCKEDFRRYALNQELLSNISLSYNKASLIDSALLYSQKALNLIQLNRKVYPDRDNFHLMAMGVIYGNQADLFLKKGDTLHAEKLLEKSIQINSRKGFDNVDAQMSMLKLGELAILRNKLENARKIIVQLDEQQASRKVSNIEMRLNRLKWMYFDHLNTPAQAFPYMKRYITLKDSLDQQQRNLELADADKEFNNIEQQYRYNLLAKDIKLKKVYLYVALLFSVLIVIILVLLWKNGKTSRKNVLNLTHLNKQITFQNLQLEQTLYDLKQSNGEKDRILKVVAHDLRSPIGAIVNISSLLLDEVAFSKEHREFMEIIKKSSWQAIEMIKDLLSTNLTNRPAELTITRIELSDLLRYSVEQLQFKAEEKEQTIVLKEAVKTHLYGDQDKLLRVLNNLIYNAIKFSPVGEAIEIETGSDSRQVTISVKDHGIGIPEELREHLFDMFTESKRRGTAGEQPFGLGLSFSKQIVEAHGGTISYESEEGKGSVFTISLPLLQTSSSTTIS